MRTGGGGVGGGGGGVEKNGKTRLYVTWCTDGQRDVKCHVMIP